MYIQTVHGPIAAESLGVTLTHEHFIIDYRCVWSEPPANYAHLAEAELTRELIDEVRRNPHHAQSNLVLNDEETAIRELAHFKQSGGRAMVELTSFGLSPDPLKLRRISTATDLYVVAGCGYYRYIAQDPLVLEMKAGQLIEEIVKCLEVGIGQTDVRAGIIGEVGTSFPLHPFERESLIAAAKAQRQTGAAISVHPEAWEHGHLDVLDILEDAGADLSRTVMSHTDELVDNDWHRRIAERGVYLGFDTFGSEFYFDGIQEPRDTDRINCLVALLEMGYGDQILLSHDVCYKIQLRKYGGYGYAHVLSTIVTRLKRYGVSEIELSKMLEENPARLLAIPSRE